MNEGRSQLSLLGTIILRSARHPAVQVAAILWVVANIAVLVLAGGVLPFDRPVLAGMPFARQVALPSLTLIEVFLLMVVAYFLTCRRVTPDLAARAPERVRAALETALLLGYAGLGQVGGWLVGPRSATGPSASTSQARYSAAASRQASGNCGRGRSIISWCSPSFPIFGFAAAIRLWT